MNLFKPLVFLSLLLIPLAAGRTAVVVGGWKPIKDVKDMHVVGIGKYAVSEYDRRTKADLRFQSVLSGESQVVAGVNYKLVIKAKEGEAGASGNYEAVVWEKEWMKFKNLTSFKPLAH